jgi:hypothetical protein
MNPNPPDSPVLVVLTTQEGSLEITQSDANAVHREVNLYLKDRWPEVKATIPENLIEHVPTSAGEAKVDGLGRLRFSPWLAEADGKELVLTHRPLPSGNFQFQVPVAKVNGVWTAKSISWQKIMPAR